MKKCSILLVVMLGLFLAGCLPSGATRFESSPSQTLSTPTKTQRPSLTPTLTQTPVPATATLTPTMTSTPWPVEPFSSQQLYPGVESVAYVADTCHYLENRWGEGKSEPGTIVVPLMFHSVAQPGRVIKDNTTISMDYFEYFMATAKELGYETITTEELVGFLTENKAIPRHSMLMILDDRKPGTAALFLPYLEANDWTLTLAYPSGNYVSQSEWDQVEALYDTGRFDIQSHGFNHAYLQDFTPLSVVEEEIYGPIEAIRTHFGSEVTAMIWPGGNFTDVSIATAHEAGLTLGFTVYSRGPLLFNAIPLGEPERAMNEPLMVLPRAWSTAADVALRSALLVSEEAAQYGAAVQEQERLYYLTFCQHDGSN